MYNQCADSHRTSRTSSLRRTTTTRRVRAGVLCVLIYNNAVIYTFEPWVSRKLTHIIICITNLCTHTHTLAHTPGTVKTQSHILFVQQIYTQSSVLMGGVLSPPRVQCTRVCYRTRRRVEIIFVRPRPRCSRGRHTPTITHRGCAARANIKAIIGCIPEHKRKCAFAHIWFGSRPFLFANNVMLRCVHMHAHFICMLVPCVFAQTK